MPGRGMVAGAAIAAPAVVVFCLLAVAGVQGKASDLFDEVTEHHFHVPSPAAQTEIRHAVLAPSAHALEMKAVARVRAELHATDKLGAQSQHVHTLSEVEQGSLLADAQREMKQDEASPKRPASGHGEDEAKLAEDDDHGHVPLKFVKEALHLAQERDGPADAKLKPAVQVQHLSKAAESGLLRKALQEQKADAAKFGKFVRAPAKRSVETDEAEDKDHGHVKLKWIKLAQKLAREQGQSVAQYKTAQKPMRETADGMHRVKDWQLALMKKAEQERQDDAERVEKPLAEEMVKQGYLSDRRARENQRLRVKELATDHTDQTERQDLKKLASLAEKKGAASAGKASTQAEDTTQLHPKKSVDEYVQEAKELEDKRAADDKKVEKPLADQMVREGYLRSRDAEAKAEAKMKDRAVDHTRENPNKLQEYVKEVNMAEDKGAADIKKEEKLNEAGAKMNAPAKDTAQLHPKKSLLDEYVQEVKEVEDKRAADDKKVEKPLADQMVREGYLRSRDAEAKAEAKMKDRAVDHTRENPNKLQEYVKEVNMAEDKGAADIKKEEKPTEAGATQLHPKKSVDEYVQEAKELEDKRAADDKKVEKPLADQMVREGYLRSRAAEAKWKDRAVDHTRENPNKLQEYVKEVNMAEDKGAADIKKEEKSTEAGATQLHPKNSVDEYVQEAKELEDKRAADDKKVEKPLADQMVREGYLRSRAAEAKWKDRAVDHTRENPNKLQEYVQDVKALGVKTARKGPTDGTQLYRAVEKRPVEDYVKEAMDAKEERDADVAKVEKPLAEAMVREGYLQKKNMQTLPERAVDHTRMEQVDEKEASTLIGAAVQPRETVQPEVGQKLNSGDERTDYVKEAMEAKAERDADDEKVERPLAEAMVTEGYLHEKDSMRERAVDHTKFTQDAVKEVAQLEHKSAAGQNLDHLDQEQFAAQAAKVAKGQADFLKEAMQAGAMKMAEDRAVQAPLAKEMIKQGYLKPPHNVISRRVRPAANQSPGQLQAHPVTKLTHQNQQTATSKKAEIAKLLKVVDRSTWHDPAQKPSMSRVAEAMRGKQAKLLNLAMKAEEGQRQEDQNADKNMSRDIKAERQLQVRTALTMKEDVQNTRALINKAIKEQNTERAKGENEMRLDKAAEAALSKTNAAGSGRTAHAKGNLFDQAVKEARADRAKGRAERDQDLKVAQRAESAQSEHQTLSLKKAGHDNLIQQAIQEQEDAMRKGIKEEEIDNRAAETVQPGLSTEGRGTQESLIKLARQAMRESDDDEAAKQAKERADDEAEVIVHKEHVEARTKSEASSRDGIIAELGKDFFKTRVQPQLKATDSMLMLVKAAESEASKDQALAK